MTLHLILHRSRAEFARATMQDCDKVILGGDALTLAYQHFPAQRVCVLATDCQQRGIAPPENVSVISDAEWVEMTASADRVIHW